ncbi:hypothetical protein BpHYR1_021805, partial [Brachionus plicatilis]
MNVCPRKICGFIVIENQIYGTSIRSKGKVRINSNNKQLKLESIRVYKIETKGKQDKKGEMIT